jgi:anti-sigma regulatory factor (Ser/Thr protein kinase)
VVDDGTVPTGDTGQRAAEHARSGLHHAAVFYRGIDEFLIDAVPFLLAGVEANAAVLVVVGPAKIEALRDTLGGAGESVVFADMEAVGRNPGRLIPMWRDFADEHAPTGRELRGVGEPVFAGRRADEIVECQRHERLVNCALAGVGAPMHLSCPYDVDGLDSTVIAEAHRTHPYVRRAAAVDEPGHYRDGEFLPQDPLPPPPPSAVAFAFDESSLRDVRRFVARRAADVGVEDNRADDLVLAVNELATNSVRHGGGGGTVRVWSDPAGDRLVCEVGDRGTILDPMAGRVRPRNDHIGGRGLWMVNQLCDLVQLRSGPAGSAIRLHVVRGATA